EVPAAIALAEVAAERTHVADLRAADVAGRFGQTRERLAQRAVLGDGRQGRAGADGDRRRLDLDAGQVLDAAQADDLVRLGHILFLQVEQVGTAGQQLGGAPARVQEPDRLLSRRRSIISKVLQGDSSSRATTNNTNNTNQEIRIVFYSCYSCYSWL